MRYALLSLLLFALPVSAQEYEVIVTGDASTTSGSAVGPVDVSFDFNALSPVQSFNFAGGCLNNFSAMIPITGLSASIGGQQTGVTGSAMSFSGGPLSGTGTCNPIESNLLISFPGGLLLTLQNQATTSLGTYPLVGLLQDAGPQSGSLDGYNVSDINITLEPVGVPEPGTVALMALALVGLFAVHGRRLVDARA